MPSNLVHLPSARRPGADPIRSVRQPDHAGSSGGRILVFGAVKSAGKSIADQGAGPRTVGDITKQQKIMRIIGVALSEAISDDKLEALLIAVETAIGCGQSMPF